MLGMLLRLHGYGRLDGLKMICGAGRKQAETAWHQVGLGIARPGIGRLGIARARSIVAGIGLAPGSGSCAAERTGLTC